MGEWDGARMRMRMGRKSSKKMHANFKLHSIDLQIICFKCEAQKGEIKKKLWSKPVCKRLLVWVIDMPHVMIRLDSCLLAGQMLGVVAGLWTLMREIKGTF